MVLLANRRPRYDDFRNAKVLMNEDELSFTVPDALVGRDFWLYIAILPTKYALDVRLYGITH